MMSFHIQSVRKPNSNMLLNQLINPAVSNGATTAHSNGFARAHALTISNQPTLGMAHRI